MQYKPLKRAVVVDGDEIWLKQVERALEGYGFPSVATARSFQHAEVLLTGEEDVLVTEVVVAHESCFALVARVLQARSHARVLAMSNRASRPQVFRLREHGVHAYLEKPFAAPALHRCLESLARTDLGYDGGAPLSLAPEPPTNSRARPAVDAMLHHYRQVCSLTNAEAEVLRALLCGERRVDIAGERCVSINTIKTQIRSILGKCQATTVRQLRRELMNQL